MTRSIALALLALGTGLAWIGSARAWWRASGGAAQVGLSGNEVSTGLTQGLALVAAAGLLLLLVLRGVGRRILAVLLTLVGIGMIVAGGHRFRPDDQTAVARLREVGLVDGLTLTATAWPWLYAVGGVLVVAGAGVMLVTLSRWRSGPDRFARSSRSRPADRPAIAADPLSAWRSLDAGVDPTLSASAEPLPPTPDVQSVATGDTMGRDHHKQGSVNPTERRTS